MARQTAFMQIGIRQARAARLCATTGAVIFAPLLLLAGGPLLYRFLRYVNREDGPGLIDKERGWVHPGYFVVLNPLVRGLTWPTEQIWEAFQAWRGWPDPRA